MAAVRASGAAPRDLTTVVTSAWPVRASAMLMPPGCSAQLRSESTTASSPTRATRWVASSCVRGSWHSAYQRRAVFQAAVARRRSADSSTNSVTVDCTCLDALPAGACPALALDLRGGDDAHGALEGAHQGAHPHRVGEPLPLARDDEPVAVEVGRGGLLAPGEPAAVAPELVVVEQRGLVERRLRRAPRRRWWTRPRCWARAPGCSAPPLRTRRPCPRPPARRRRRRPRPRCGYDGARCRRRMMWRAASARPRAGRQVLEQVADAGGGHVAGDGELRVPLCSSRSASRRGRPTSGRSRPAGSGELGEQQHPALPAELSRQRVEGRPDLGVEALLAVPQAGGVPALGAPAPAAGPSASGSSSRETLRQWCQATAKASRTAVRDAGRSPVSAYVWSRSGRATSVVERVERVGAPHGRSTVRERTARTRTPGVASPGRRSRRAMMAGP